MSSNLPEYGRENKRLRSRLHSPEGIQCDSEHNTKGSAESQWDSPKS